MHVETFSVGPLGCNCSIVADLEAKTAVVVDPGGDFPQIEARISALGVTVERIVHTHTHIDHVGATAPLQRLAGCSACIHEADRFLYDLLPVQAAMLGCPLPETVQMDGSLVDGATFALGSSEMCILHTPGHTPGSTCFTVRDATSGASWVFTGDTLFRRSIGRTDLWGGDHDAILKSIRERLVPLAGDAIVISGHGPSSTIERERAENPFLREMRA